MMLIMLMRRLRSTGRMLSSLFDSSAILEVFLKAISSTKSRTGTNLRLKCGANIEAKFLSFGKPS